MGRDMNKFFISCVLGMALTHAPVFARTSQTADFHSNIAYVVDVDSGEELVDRNS
jgi:hypothetical protein